MIKNRLSFQDLIKIRFLRHKFNLNLKILQKFLPIIKHQLKINHSFYPFYCKKLILKLFSRKILYFEGINFGWNPASARQIKPSLDLTNRSSYLPMIPLVGFFHKKCLSLDQSKKELSINTDFFVKVCGFFSKNSVVLSKKILNQHSDFLFKILSVIKKKVLIKEIL